jgi:hypothetical protein
MTTTTPNFATDTIRQTTDTFNKAFQAGVKFQEDTFRTFNENATRATDEFRNRVERFADEMTPVTKKNVDRFTKMFDENTQRTSTFVRSAFDTNPFIAPVSNPTELMDRTMNFWKNAFETTRESFEAFNKTSQDAWTSFTQCCKAGECCQTATADTTAKKPASK